MKVLWNGRYRAAGAAIIQDGKIQFGKIQFGKTWFGRMQSMEIQFGEIHFKEKWLEKYSFKTYQELRMLSLSQEIYDQKVILNNIALNCQQCNQKYLFKIENSE